MRPQNFPVVRAQTIRDQVKRSLIRLYSNGHPVYFLRHGMKISLKDARSFIGEKPIHRGTLNFGKFHSTK